MSSNSASAPAAEAGTGGSGRSRLWQGLLGVAISIGFLVWALWGIPVSDVLRNIRHAHPGWYLASCVVATSTFFIRAVRWRVLLVPVVGETPLEPVWRATAIGFMANNVLPARAGEVVKGWAVTRLVRVTFPTALATIVVERIFDGVAIGLLLALAIWARQYSGAATIGSTNLSVLAITVSAVFVGVLVFCLAVVRARSRVLPVFESLLRKLLPERWAGRAGRLLHSLTDGLAVLHSTREVLRVLTWSFALWLVNAASYLIAYHAFAPAWPPFPHLPVTSTFLLQGITALGVAIPAAPGFFGSFEAFARASLALYDVPASAAVSLAIGIHMGWFVPITAIGLWYLGKTGLSLRELRTADSGTAARRDSGTDPVGGGRA